MTGGENGEFTYSYHYLTSGILPPTIIAEPREGKHPETTAAEKELEESNAAAGASSNTAPQASSREGNRLVRGGSDTPRPKQRDDGIAPPGHGRPNHSPSEDRATGHSNEIVLRHPNISEEALGASELDAAAAAPTMATGGASREVNSLPRVEGTSPHPRENAPWDAQGQEPLHVKQQLLPTPYEAAQEAGIDVFESKYNIADVIGPEEEPPDAQNEDEDSRSPVDTKRRPDPRTANRNSTVTRTMISGGGALVSGWGLVPRLLWRTRPKPEGQAQSDGELEAVSLIAEQSAGFWFHIFLMTWF